MSRQTDKETDRQKFLKVGKKTDRDLDRKIERQTENRRTDGDIRGTAQPHKKTLRLMETSVYVMIFAYRNFVTSLQS